MGRVAADLQHFLLVVVGDQGLVLVQLLERFDRLDRVGIDDSIPDVILPLLGRQMGDLFVNGQEFGDAGHVEAGTQVIERLDDSRIAIGLHGIVNLYPRQILAELGVIIPQGLVIDDEQRRAVGLGQAKQRLLIHDFSASGREQGIARRPFPSA